MSLLELEIRSLLNERSDLDLVADELLRKWDTGQASRSEQNKVAHFLFRTGYYSTFLHQCVSALLKNQTLHWDVVNLCIAEYFNKVQSSDSTAHSPEEIKNIFDVLFLYAGEQNMLELFCRPNACDNLDARFAKARMTFLQEKQKLQEQEISQAINKAQALSNQGLYNEAKGDLEPLLMRYPNHAQIKNFLNELYEQHRRSLITHRRSHPITAEELVKKLEKPFSSEEKAEQEKILKTLIDQAKQNQDMAYDTAIGLNLMGFFKEALDALAKVPDSQPVQWLKLELLLENHYFLEAFDLSQTIEKKFSEDPESVFAALYARAKALWGMEKTREAIEILENIVKARPNYRSAHSLLTEWKEFKL